MRTALRLVLAVGVLLLIGASGYVVVSLQGCSSSATQPAKIAKAEAELCTARALYKLAAAAAGGSLDPAPGSPRAKLEAAEDRFCAARAGDAGP